jgi:hypothetical protein
MTAMLAHTTHTTTPPTPDPAPWDGTIHWLTGAVDQVAHWVTWTFTMQHLAEAVVVGAPLVALVGAVRTWHIFRVLRARRAWAVIPTERYIRRLTDELVTNVGRILSQVRRPAVGLGWWLWPASAIRLRLDLVNRGGTIYSMSGPPWAREVIELATYTGLILCPMDALDLGRLTPKGLYVAPEEPFDFDAQTQPDGLPTLAGS